LSLLCSQSRGSWTGRLHRCQIPSLAYFVHLLDGQLSGESDASVNGLSC
jgi:hypothetical protein